MACTDYDGKKIPFEDNTFNVIYSSNALEHIPHTFEFQKEILRALKPDGYAFHILHQAVGAFGLTLQRF